MMTKKRVGAKAKSKQNAAKENNPPGLEEEIKHDSKEGIKRGPAEDSKQGSTEGIKRCPAETNKQGSTEGIKRGHAEESKQGSTEGVHQGSKESTKHDSKKDIKRGKGKRKPGKGVKREPAKDSKQDSSEDSDSSDENNDVSEEESKSDFVKTIERGGEKALEVFADGIVEVLFFLEKRYKTFRKCIQNINFVTFFLFISVMQCYTAVHFAHVLVYLLSLTGLQFQFPLKDANLFISNFIDYLAWDFKLFISIVTIISFINDLINTGYHEKNHVDGIWMLLLAEIEIFLLAPPSEDFGDYLLVALKAITVARLLFEVCYNDSEDLNSSLDFLPLLVFMQLVVFMFCAFLVFLYEAAKLLEEYVPDKTFLTRKSR